MYLVGGGGSQRKCKQQQISLSVFLRDGITTRTGVGKKITKNKKTQKTPKPCL